LQASFEAFKLSDVIALCEEFTGGINRRAI